MFLQRFLKGIADVSYADASAILTQSGIQSQWLNNDGLQAGKDIQRRMTWRNLDWHLNHYDDPDPLERKRPFKEHTPFISTTAGTIERNIAARENFTLSAFRTALEFATRQYTTTGWIFHGYLYVIGKQSIPLEPFAEEVRDVHVYTGWLQYQHEGEITAKLRIPAVNLEKCEEWDGRDVLAQLGKGDDPVAKTTIVNPDFSAPELYTNLRGLIE
jgi:hypothetical protein